MAKTKLKRMDRFELLELLYNMRKANLDLTERLEAAEKKIEELKKEADQRVLDVRSEYVQRLDDLRMQGSARDLQKRMNEIEEQLIMFQQLSGRAMQAVKQENASPGEGTMENLIPPPPANNAAANGSEARQEASGTAMTPIQVNSGASVTPDSEAGESRE